MPLVTKSPAKPAPKLPEPPGTPQYEVKIVGGRRVVIWKNGDNGLQRGYRPPPTRAIVPLPSQVGVAAAGAPAATSSDKSTNSQYKFPPPAENPHSEKQNVTPPQQQQETRQQEEVVDWNTVSQDRTPASSSERVLENHKEPGVILAASAPRVTSDVTAGPINSSPILPPISSAESSPQPSGGSSRPLGELEKITLKNEIYRNADVLQERRLQRILNEMRTLDRDRDGVLAPVQTKRTLQKHQLRLDPGAEANLVRMFEKMPGQVKYEALVQYLSSVKLEASRTVAPPAAPTKPAAVPAPPRHGRTITGKDDVRLREDLKEYLRPRRLDLDILERSLNEADRDRNGFLTYPQTEDALQSGGLSDMPAELRYRLCLAADKQGNGLSNIDRLMLYVTRAQPSFRSSTLHGLGSNHHPRPAKEPPPVNTTQHRAPSYLPRLEEQPEPPTPPPAAAPAGAEDAAPYDTVYPPSPPTEQFDEESWRQDYQHLVNALHQSDVEGSGYMEFEEVGRITESYSTIYSMGISLDMINQALTHATEPNYGLINLQVYTEYLLRLFLSMVA